LIELKANGEVAIPESGMKLTYSEIFVLINLIQEKSNALFMRSTTRKKKYQNGILRLLIVLCKMEKNILLLQELGWNWNEPQGRFEYLPKEKIKTRAKYKYYLTADEYKTIMNTKKS
jgi:hypothetical protein